MNYIVSAATDIGNTKDTNQDAYSVRVYMTPLGKMTLAVLCDGMGGLAKGEVASATVINAFLRWGETRLGLLCEKGSITDADIRQEWTRLVTDYNAKIKSYGNSNGINLGTTLTAILLTDNRYFVINVGDSRTYELTGFFKLLTKDQSLVEREIELGRLTEEQARTDPRRSVLLQCIGASDSVSPDFYFGQTQKDAVYMLCSDGFRHEITPEEIYSALGPGVLTDENIMQANMVGLINLNKSRFERDNITVVCVRTY